MSHLQGHLAFFPFLAFSLSLSFFLSSLAFFLSVPHFFSFDPVSFVVIEPSKVTLKKEEAETRKAVSLSLVLFLPHSLSVLSFFFLLSFFFFLFSSFFFLFLSISFSLSFFFVCKKKKAVSINVVKSSFSLQMI